MKPIICFACVVALFLPFAAHAEVFRCVQPDGSVRYADEPCVKGEKGGQIDVQPMTIDTADGRERTQKFLSDLSQQSARQTEAAPAAQPGGTGGGLEQSERRMQRWARCEPLLDEASGVRRQAIGALCGADLDEALFDTCLNKVQAAQGVSETDAVVRACTGTGLQNGAVLVQPARPRYIPVPVPVPCSQRPHDPACARPPSPPPSGQMGTFKAPAKSFKDQQEPAPVERSRGWQDNRSIPPMNELERR